MHGGILVSFYYMFIVSEKNIKSYIITYLTIEKYYSIRGYLPCTPTSIYNAGIFKYMTAECSLYLLIVPTVQTF